MNQKWNRVLLVALLLVISVFSWAVYAEKKETVKTVWEYTVASSITGDDANRLTELGNHGWELTSVRTEEEMLGNFRQTRIYYYFKRPTQVAR